MKLNDLKLLKELLIQFGNDYLDPDCDNCYSYSISDVYSMVAELIIKSEDSWEEKKCKID